MTLRGGGTVIETQVRYSAQEKAPPTVIVPPTTNLRFAWDGTALPATGLDCTFVSEAPRSDLALRGGVPAGRPGAGAGDFEPVAGGRGNARR